MQAASGGHLESRLRKAATLFVCLPVSVTPSCTLHIAPNAFAAGHWCAFEALTVRFDKLHQCMNVLHRAEATQLRWLHASPLSLLAGGQKPNKTFAAY